MNFCLCITSTSLHGNNYVGSGYSSGSRTELFCDIRPALPVCAREVHLSLCNELIMAQPRCFRVGDVFSSYEDLKKHVEEFERKTSFS